MKNCSDYAAYRHVMGQSSLSADFTLAQEAAARLAVFSDLAEDGEAAACAAACNACSRDPATEEEDEEQQIEGAGLLLSSSSGKKNYFPSLKAALALLLCCSVCIAVLLAFLPFPRSVYVGGPLGESFPIGSNLNCKGPPRQADGSCLITGFPEHDPFLSKLVNSDMLTGPAWTSSTSAFFSVWFYFFSLYFPKRKEVNKAFQGNRRRGGEEEIILIGNEAECNFRVVRSCSRCLHTSDFGFPIAVPPPTRIDGFLLPFDSEEEETNQPSAETGAAAAQGGPVRQAAAAGAAEGEGDGEEEEGGGEDEGDQEQAEDSFLKARSTNESTAGESVVFSRVKELCGHQRIPSSSSSSSSSPSSSYPPSYSTTVVMGLWQLPPPALSENKNKEKYMQQFRLGLELFAPHQAVIAFADSEYLPLMSAAVHASAAAAAAAGDSSFASRVCVVPLELHELPHASLSSHIRIAASSAIRDARVSVDWWNHAFFNESYHVVQLSKFGVTAEVALVNPFNSKFIWWLDPPKIEFYPANPADISRFLDGDFLNRNVKRGAILLQATPQRILEGSWSGRCHQGVFKTHDQYGPGIVGCFGGTPFAFKRRVTRVGCMCMYGAQVYPVWDAAARALLSLSILNDEQHLHTLAACAFPSLFHVIPYHPSCAPHYLCFGKLLAGVHPAAEVSFDLQGRQLNGPQPRESWKEYPFSVSTSLDVPEAVYAQSKAKDGGENDSR
ncbi:hypothetical protein Efla_007188 [Eimeria flavescens]